MAEPYDAPNVIPIRSGLGGVRDTAPLPKGDGGGTSDGMGPWEQSVESRLGQLHGDLRLMMGALVAGFLFLILAFGAGYKMLADQMQANTDKLVGKLDILVTQTNSVSERVAKLEGAAEAKAPPITRQSPAK